MKQGESRGLMLKAGRLGFKMVAMLISGIGGRVHQGPKLTAHKQMIKISRNRKDLVPNVMMNRTSAPVISTPPQIGMWKSRFRATADPMTSARSVAAIATSAMNQRTYTSCEETVDSGCLSHLIY